MESFSSRIQSSRITSYLKFFGNLTLLISSLLLFLVVVISTLPAIESYAYTPTRCVVDEVKVLSSSATQQSCKCKAKRDGMRCTINYPCIQVFVNYTDNRDAFHRAMVCSHWRNVGEHCSYKLRRSECHTEASVYTKLESFRQEWGKNKKMYDCFYKKGSGVVLHNDSPSLAFVVHSTLWPALGVVAGLVLITFNKKIIEICKRTSRDTDHIPLMEHET